MIIPQPNLSVTFLLYACEVKRCQALIRSYDAKPANISCRKQPHRVPFGDSLVNFNRKSPRHMTFIEKMLSRCKRPHDFWWTPVVIRTECERKKCLLWFYKLSSIQRGSENTCGRNFINSGQYQLKSRAFIVKIRERLARSSPVTRNDAAIICEDDMKYCRNVLTAEIFHLKHSFLFFARRTHHGCPHGRRLRAFMMSHEDLMENCHKWKCEIRARASSTAKVDWWEGLERSAEPGEDLSRIFFT